MRVSHTVLDTFICVSLLADGCRQTAAVNTIQCIVEPRLFSRTWFDDTLYCILSLRSDSVRAPFLCSGALTVIARRAAWKQTQYLIVAVLEYPTA